MKGKPTWYESSAHSDPVDLSIYVLPDAEQEIDSLLDELGIVVRRKLLKRLKKLPKIILEEISLALQQELDANLMVSLTHDADLIDDKPPYEFAPSSNARLEIGLPVGKEEYSGRSYDVNLYKLVDYMIKDNYHDEESLRFWAGTFLVLTEKIQKAVEEAATKVAAPPEAQTK